MTITQFSDNKKVTLCIEGRIDTGTAEELQSYLQKLDYSGLNLTLDFHKTEYITSAGLRALLVARKRLSDETMRIVGANEEIRNVFAVTGFSEMIRLEENESESSSESSSEKESSADSDPAMLSFVRLLRKRVEQNGTQKAYTFKEKDYSWRDIEVGSQIIANDLAQAGVQKGSHVGLCAPNSMNWVFTFFAIQKLGGIAVLVNPELQPEELAGMIKTADIEVLCYGETPGLTDLDSIREGLSAVSSLPKTMYPISSSVDFGERFGEYPSVSTLYRQLYSADDASVVIFSSGSTGRPKAILNSPGNMLSSIRPIIQEMRTSPHDINLAFLPFFHVFGLLSAIGAGLLFGFRNIIPEFKLPELMIELIEKYQCTVFNTVPAMFWLMMEVPDFSPEKLKSLRVTLLGGSVTTEAQMAMLQKMLPQNHFGNIYGMSENPVTSYTLYEDTVAHLTGTVGKPTPTLEIQIRRPNSRERMDVGQEGEVCIRTRSMIVCYYHLPAEQQPLDEEGWLSTGDLGYLDQEGYLHLTGRCKDLIISGGENLSPGEIAEEIARLPEIADVKVLGLPDAIMGEVVAAAVVLKAGAVWDEEKVQERLKKRLAWYKVPLHYLVLERMPLLGSGKADVLTLRKMMEQKFLK